MTKKVLLPIIILGVVILSAGNAMAYNINGQLDDWGVTSLVGGSENWTPNAGIYYTVEDTTSDFVGPGSGGQKFDAEAMYLTWDDTNLYLALVTGFPKDGGVYSVSAGDIAIDFGVDGNYEYGVEIEGHAPGYWGLSNDDDRGHVYRNVTWNGPSYYPESDPLVMVDNAEIDLGASTYAYSNYNAGDALYDRWVLEMSIPRGYFGTDWNNYMRLHWTQTCGNDNINVTTPEPMSMALFGIGALGALFRVRRKLKR